MDKRQQNNRFIRFLRTGAQRLGRTDAAAPVATELTERTLTVAESNGRAAVLTFFFFVRYVLLYVLFFSFRK